MENRETKQKAEQVVEIQMPDKEDLLDDLMSKVSLADPLEIPLSSGQILTITQEQFISYYLPPDATRLEKANCFNEVRAAGLNPAIRGDCHFFRTADQPLHLFVGYHVYLRQAWKNGLQHIHKPVIEMGEDGQPFSCTITLEIEGRPDFEWTTWFWEVAGTDRDGKLNKRWNKAEKQMLIKCSLTNIFRISGLVDFTLAPAVEEIDGLAVAPGHRTLTPAQLDAYGPQDYTDGAQEPSLGEVSATDHQIDMTPFRKRYHGRLKLLAGLGWAFAGDDERRKWQEEKTGQVSSANWDAENYADALDELTVIKGELAPGVTWKELTERAKVNADKPEEQEPEIPLDEDGDPLEDGMMTPADEEEEAARQACLEEERQVQEPDWEEVKAEVDAQVDEMFEEAKANGEVSDPEADPDPELLEASRKYDMLAVGAFGTPAMLAEWELMLAGTPVKNWNVEQYQRGKIALEALKEAQAEVKGVWDMVALMNLYLESIKGFWDSAQEMSDFQHRVTGRRSFQDFGMKDLRLIYPIVMSLKAIKTATVESEESESASSGQIAGTALYKEIVALCGQLRELYPSVASLTFKNMLMEVIGCKPKPLGTMSLEHGEMVINHLKQQLEEKSHPVNQPA